MILKKNEIEEKIIPNFNGGEKQYNVHMFTDEHGKIMFGKLISGASIGMHTHQGSSEVIYLVKGRAKVLYDDKVEYLNPGEVHYCEEGHSHSLINETDSDVEFIGIVPKY